MGLNYILKYVYFKSAVPDKLHTTYMICDIIFNIVVIDISDGHIQLFSW